MDETKLLLLFMCNGYNISLKKSHFSFSVLCPELHWTHLHGPKMKYNITPVFFHGENTLGIMTINGCNLLKKDQMYVDKKSYESLKHKNKSL